MYTLGVRKSESELLVSWPGEAAVGPGRWRCGGEKDT